MIKPFLEAHRAEVKGMLLEEYNETEVMELFKEEGGIEGREEGRAEGREEARNFIFKSLVSGCQSGSIKIDFAAQLAGMSVEEFLEKMKPE